MADKNFKDSQVQLAGWKQMLAVPPLGGGTLSMDRQAGGFGTFLSRHFIFKMGFAPGNEIGAGGAQAIAKVMEANSSVEYIDLHSMCCMHSVHSMRRHFFPHWLTHLDPTIVLGEPNEGKICEGGRRAFPQTRFFFGCFDKFMSVFVLNFCQLFNVVQ